MPTHLPADLDTLRLRLRARLRPAPEDTDQVWQALAGVPPAQREAVRALLPPRAVAAAVLMPIILRPQGPTLLFTERAAHLRHHAGQISFPGGRIEAHDRSVMAAALREAEEEIGLPASQVEVLGWLPSQWVVSGFCIHPLVGVVAPEPTLRVDRREVARVFEAPLAHLLNPLNHLDRVRQLGEVRLTVSDIPYGEHRIWGATAALVHRLGRSLAAAAE